MSGSRQGLVQARTLARCPRKQKGLSFQKYPKAQPCFIKPYLSAFTPYLRLNISIRPRAEAAFC